MATRIERVSLFFSGRAKSLAKTRRTSYAATSIIFMQPERRIVVARAKPRGTMRNGAAAKYYLPTCRLKHDKRVRRDFCCIATFCNFY
jgi:hypothetical protein